VAEPSLAQQSFLEQRKRKLRAITLARIFIFLLFLLIWEASARLHLIDAFIFSSPSRVCEIFVSMMADRSVFMHIGTTLAETLLSFFLVFLFSLLTAASYLAFFFSLYVLLSSSRLLVPAIDSSCLEYCNTFGIPFEWWYAKRCKLPLPYLKLPSCILSIASLNRKCIYVTKWLLNDIVPSR